MVRIVYTQESVKQLKDLGAEVRYNILNTIEDYITQAVETSYIITLSYFVIADTNLYFVQTDGAVIITDITNDTEESLVTIDHKDVTDIFLDKKHPIKVFREASGLSQVNLASDAGCQQSYITKLEDRSRKGTASRLSTIAKRLDIDVELLI